MAVTLPAIETPTFMRILEILLILLTVLAAACLGTGRWRRAARLLSACALAISVAHFIWEGAHWQMIPAYAAMGIVLLVAWIPKGGRWLPITGAAVGLLFAAVSMFFCFLLPVFRLPKPTGPYAVGTRTLYLKDASRTEDAGPASGAPRELMIQVWYPAEASKNPLAHYRDPRETQRLSSYQSLVVTNSRLDAPVAAAGAPFPVVLFNHGWHGRRTNDTFLTEELASHGYVVASIDHTYNASLVAFPDGRVAHTTAALDIDYPDGSTQQRVKTIWDRELEKQTADQEFVLNQLEALNRTSGSPWFARLNTKLAAAVGHSFGGAASTELCAVDRRVHAAINMDGWFFGAIQARGQNQPLLFLDASDAGPGSQSAPSEGVAASLNVSDYADMMSSMRQFGGYMVSINGAEHEDFTDQPLVSPLRSLAHRGTIPAAKLEIIVRSYVLAFLDKELRGKDAAVLDTRSNPFSEVKVQVWPPLEHPRMLPVAVEGR
jgi:dienelactone hydrolase